MFRNGPGAAGVDGNAWFPDCAVLHLSYRHQAKQPEPCAPRRPGLPYGDDVHLEGNVPCSRLKKTNA